MTLWWGRSVGTKDAPGIAEVVRAAETSYLFELDLVAQTSLVVVYGSGRDGY